MDDPKHPNPDLELPPPPEEKLIPAHAESGETNPEVNPAGNAGGSKHGKWRLVTMGIIAVIILEAISIYFLRTDNDIKFLQSFLGGNPTPTTAPTLAPQPSPTSMPTPTYSLQPESSESGTMCTADAMKCPDGSYVGRTGPKCEFVCPQN